MPGTVIDETAVRIPALSIASIERAGLQSFHGSTFRASASARTFSHIGGA
jgi:hypothetical protein